MRGLALIGWLPALLACQLQTGATGGTTPSSMGSSSSASSGDDRASGASSAQNITLPDIMGMSKPDAEAALSSAGLQGGMRIGNDPGSVDFAVAKVCTQTPGGGQQTSSSLFVTVRFCQPEVVAAGVELVGHSVADAQKRAKAAGWVGKFEVIELYEFAASCKADSVCGVEPTYWEKLKEPRDTLKLYVNKKVTISVPD